MRIRRLTRSFFTIGVVVVLVVGLTPGLGFSKKSAEKGRHALVSRPFEYSGYTFPEYTTFVKSSEYVTMNDGTNLAIDIFLPSGYTGSEFPPDKFPVVFQYTPYQRASMRSDGTIADASRSDLNRLLLSHGYAIAVADMRGCGASFGWMADFMLQICDDGKELVDWIARQDWCDGNVGMSGGSYLGWSQLCVAHKAPEALKCIMPAVVPLEGYTGEVYPGGIYLYAFLQLWSGGQYPALRNFSGFQAAPVIDEDGDGDLADEIPVDQNSNGTFLDDYPPVYPDGVSRVGHFYFFATFDHAAHPDGAPGNYDYDTWASQAFFIDYRRPSDNLTPSDLLPNFLPDVMDSQVPIYNVGGWFDGFARGSFELYCTMKDTNPSRLIMRPSYHGPVSPGFAELLGIDLEAYAHGLNVEALRWYDRWLKGIKNGIDTEDPILIYVMNGEGWRQEKRWPLARQQMTKFYFHEGNKLSTKTPKLRSKQASDDYAAVFTHNSGWDPIYVGWLDSINYLLGKPPAVTDYFFRNRYLSVAGAAPESLPIRTEMDQHSLTYTSDPMNKDTEVTGHPIVHIWVSSTADHGDLYFYLEDVDETGEAILVSEYPLRAGFAALVDNDREIATDDGVDVLPDLPWHGYTQADYVDGIFSGGHVVELVNDFHPTSWVFKRGHRIRVSIACSDWPTFRLHPRLCPDNTPDSCPPQPPVITLYRDRYRPSHLVLPIVKSGHRRLIK